MCSSHLPVTASLFDLHNQYSKEVFLNSEEPSAEIIQYKLAAGNYCSDALMIFISKVPFKSRKSDGIHRSFDWVGIVFVIDSSVSAHYGAIYNIVIINLVAFL